MINEHDRVILSVDLPKSRLLAGDVGVVVHVYDQGKGFEVEFLSLTGDTLSVETLSKSEIRAAESKDVPHVRVQNDAA